jgi:hypothetical protein
MSQPEVMRKEAEGFGAVVIGVIALVSPFLVGRLSGSPLWIFVAGVALSVAAVWLGISAARAPRGALGRRAGVVGIVLGILGSLFSALVAIVGWIVEHDTTL